MHKRTVVAAALALPLGALVAGPAHAQDTTIFHAQLGPVNDSGASGTGTVHLEGTSVTVDIDASGLAANLPHAQHFHIGGKNTCAPPDADENGDGFVSTTEGVPYYGPVAVSLTTEGDTSAESVLAIDRMPEAEANGDVRYSRTFAVSEDVADSIKSGEVVVEIHGIDANDNGEYDFDAAGESDLDPELPAEATHPALCGELRSAPDGAMAAGYGGGAGGGASVGLIGLGAALVAAAVAATLRLWRTRPAGSDAA